MGHIIVHLNGLIDIAERHQVENRRKRLSLHDVPMVFRDDDGRLDEVAGAIDTVAAGEQFTAFRDRFAIDAATVAAIFSA